MLRMEIALLLVVAFVAYMYFSAEKEHSALNRTFSVLLVSVLVHLALDGITVYTVNHLDTVPELLNGIVHRLFLGSMVLVIFLFYQYIAIMDINIPIMNGLKVIQMSRLKHPDTAFVIVSGYDDFSYCREALRLQITDYILKPVNYEEFGTCIDNLKIALFQRQSSRQETLQEGRPIHGLTRYLQEHLAGEVSLTVLAEEFHLNPQYISQLFKSEIGVNFLAYLTNIRMEKAKNLLLTTSLSIAEVSEKSGYADYRVFTKVFKKSEGVTPSQYRRDFLEKA